MEEITPTIRTAVVGAYPWPATLAEALQEVKAWDRLSKVRALFCHSGEWNHYREVNCRITLLEDELETGRPASTWDDVQARFDWKRYAYERTWVDPTQREEPFLERLEADFALLRAHSDVQSGHPVNSDGGRAEGMASDAPRSYRTNALKRAEVIAALATNPDLSDREIAR